MKKLDKKLKAELQHLASMPDDEINTDDISEITNFTNTVVGKFYRPVKKQITLRVDADLLAWFKTQGKGYQTRMNEALREFVKNHSDPVTRK